MGGRSGLLRAALGLGVSAFAVALVVRTVDLGAAAAVLRSAQPSWIALLLAFVVADVALRALRWRVLLAPVASVPYRTALGALLVGYLANNVLPARLGELVRSHVLGARTGISRTTVLGTVVVERVVDTAVVVSIAAGAILVLSVRGIVASAVLVGLAVTALLVVVVGVAIAANRLPGADRVAGMVAGRPRIAGILRNLREGLAVARRPRTMAAAVGLSVASWTCTVLAFAAAAQAVGIEPTMGQAGLLAAGTNLATALPSAPGYVGTFELAVVTIAGSVAIAAEPALAFGVLLHAATLLLTSASGAVVLALGGSRGRPLRVLAGASATTGPQDAARDVAGPARSADRSR